MGVAEHGTWHGMQPEFQFEKKHDDQPWIWGLPQFPTKPYLYYWCLHVPLNHIKSKSFLAPSTLPCCKFVQILLKSLNPIILGYHLTSSLANWMFRLSEMVSMTELQSCKRTSSRCLRVNHAWKTSPRIVDKWRQLIIDWLGSPKS